MVSVEKLSLHFGAFELFKNISFLINPNDKIGLVGKNGAGKSTLIKIICGQQGYNEGTINMPKDIKIGYLPQQLTPADGKTVFEETRTAFDELVALEKTIAFYNEQIAQRTDYESNDYIELIEKLNVADERYRLLGGSNYEAEIETTLKGLGFLPTDFERKTSEFSGGWRMRIEIAKILLKKPNLFLLDEPTNHLDIESIQWLEDFLKNYNGAVVLISHDRAFLDAVTKRTIEISLGKIYDYKVSYSMYVKLRSERRQQQLAAFANQQKMIEKTEDFINRFRYKATKSIQVQARIKQLDKLERIEIDEEDTSAIHLNFLPAPPSGSVVLQATNITKTYGSLQVIDGIDLTLVRGDKVAFVGRNGEGKTTFSKIILNEISYSGNINIGHNVKIGYYAQNQDELIDSEKTVLQVIDESASGEIRTEIRNILGAFLFSGDDVDKKVKVLSGGERSRLALAKLLLQPVNFLLLDEPTNHLDMRSKEILKKALLAFNGTLVVVSHDRDFLDGLVSKIYEFKNKKIKEYQCNIYEFLQKKKIRSLKELEKNNTPKTLSLSEILPQSKIQYLEKKEIERTIRKIKNRITTCENKIEEIEKMLSAITQQLSNPLPNTDFNALNIQFGELNNQLKNEMQNWETLNQELNNYIIQ